MNTVPALNRRGFLTNCAVAVAALGGPAAFRTGAANPSVRATIQTVLGPIPADLLGFTLPHEHVICDFIGAGETGRHRWDVDTVVKRMLPVLTQLKERGVTGFIDCTPAYIGRDPRILKRLAQETGLHIVTNTGYYGGAGDKFVPQHAYTETVEQLSDRWIREFETDIEDTGVKPGFMKIGVDEIKTETAPLSTIDDKIVRASARTSKRTGLPVVCHTGGGWAGLAAANLFIKEAGVPDRFMVAHADGHGLPINIRTAERGVWVAFDGISRRPLEQHLKLVTAMTEKHVDRLLLSHDNGWYSVGQENGGPVRDFNYLTDTFLPALRKGGIAEQFIRTMTVDNPARAFSLARV